jgi:hypothetical protein
MTPANRHDELQDAMSRIGENLSLMDKRIDLCLASAEADLLQLRPTFCEESAKCWYDTYLTSEVNHVSYSWQELYAALLERSLIQPENAEITSAIMNIEEYRRIKKMKIERWSIPGLEYNHYLKSCRIKKLE